MATLSPPLSPQPAHMSQRPERARAVSSMSHASTSSRKSKASNKLEMMESPRDKKRFNTESKADPTAALNEATPGEIAQQHSYLQNLRHIQWKDTEGNVIIDPDRSNPTRPRLERPLDTIRSFNAAADGTSSRRSSSYGGRPMSQYNPSEASQSRPGSYYGSPGYGSRGYNRQNSAGGYYRNNSHGVSNHHVGSFDENAEYAYQDHHRPQPPRAGPGMRNINGSNPYHGNGQYNESPIAAHSHQQSYETMTSGSDENGKSTNPSSLNSSYDQLHMQHPHARKQDNYSQPYRNQYENEMNFAPVSPVSPQLGASNSLGNGNANAGGSAAPYGNANQNGAGYYPQKPGQQQPMPPPKDGQMAGVRKPIRLDGPPAAPSSGANGNTLRKGDSTKRQSWLSRKFSRREK